jgi:hypothetical protein
MVIWGQDKENGTARSRFKEEKKMEKEMFEEMIRDWQADNADEYGELEIDDAVIEGGKWIAVAHDDKNDYQLSDDGTGNIRIDYLGAH